MSTLSKVTSGAAASKKFRVVSPPSLAAMASASGSDVRGPEAMTTSPSGMDVTSPGTRVIRGWDSTDSVTIRAKPSRSTASAPPAALLSMFAARFGKDTSLTSSLVSVQTAISAITMPLMVGLAEVLA